MHKHIHACDVTEVVTCYFDAELIVPLGERKKPSRERIQADKKMGLRGAARKRREIETILSTK